MLKIIVRGNNYHYNLNGTKITDARMVKRLGHITTQDEIAAIKKVISTKNVFIQHRVNSDIQDLKEISLQDVIEYGIIISDEAKADLIDTLGKGCRENTKRNLKRAISSLTSLDVYGIYSRMILQYGVYWDFTAAQSYSEGIKEIRELITK